MQMQALVAKGADVNSRNDAGRTPLHQAAYKGHTACVVVGSCGEAAWGILVSVKPAINIIHL